MKEQLTAIADKIKDLDPVAALRYFAEAHKGKIVFSTSFGWEDQVITHMIFANDIPIDVFTLETGRLFPETYYVWNRTL
ncbi:MAG: phosphoadenylyl-sulfate reductase, partial [Pedobacter sp.]